MNPVIRTGSVEGTGSAINVSLGFVPDYVEVYNYDDAGSLNPILKWWKGMTDGHAVKEVKQAVDEGGTATYDVGPQKITSGGISEYAGDDDNGEGFTIGTDGDINVTDETIFYLACRDGVAAD